MPHRCGLLVALLLWSIGCDGLVKARVKVVSTQGQPIPDALISHQRSTGDADGQFTDATGCAFFHSVVQVPHVTATIGKSGYKSQSTRLRTGQDSCLIVHLAGDKENPTGAVDIVAPENCPCDSEAGYSPMMSARFKVTGNGQVLESVALRRTDRPIHPSSQVTDARGCLGVRWIVSPRLRSIPLTLEKSGFQSARVEVPTMADPCYAVRLSGVGNLQASTVAAVANEDCGCEMFSGRIVWPEK
jgi:hypothetical protein